VIFQRLDFPYFTPADSFVWKT